MVLVDSSVWIEYLRGNEIALPVNTLIDFNNLCINDLELFSIDKHFNLMSDLHGIRLYK